MHKIKRNLSLILAVLMIVLTLPIGQLKAYGDEDVQDNGDKEYEIESIEITTTFPEDSDFTKPEEAKIGIKIVGKNLDNIEKEDIEVSVEAEEEGEEPEEEVEEGSEEENNGYTQIDKNKINFVKGSVIEITDLSGELLDGKIKIGEYEFPIFKNRPEILEVSPEGGIIYDQLEISGERLDSIKDENIQAFFKKNEEIIKVEDEYIEGEKIKTSIFKYEKLDWDFQIIKELKDNEVGISSEIIYKNLVKANREQGMKIDSLDPKEGSVEGLDINIYGDNIFSVEKNVENNIGIEEDTGKLIVKSTDGIYNNQEYREMTRYVEVLLEGEKVNIKGYNNGDEKDRLTVQIPEYEIVDSVALEDLEKDLSIHIKNEIISREGESLISYEKDKRKNAFNYIVDSKNKPKIESMSTRTIRRADGAEGVKIKGENFSTEGKTTIKLGEKLIEEKDYQINEDGTEITINLPKMDSVGLYKLKIFNSEGGIESIEIEYVEDFTEYEDIEALEILKKPNTFSKNKFLINNFTEESGDTQFKLIFKKDKKISLDLLDKISGIRLVRESDGRSVEVKKEKVDGNNPFENREDGLIISLNKVAREFLSYGAKFDRCENRETAAGKYKIYLDGKDGSSKLLQIYTREDEEDDYEKFDHLLIKDKPWVKNTYPVKNASYFNPENLYERFTQDGQVESGYYIRANFDNQGELDFVEDPDGRNPSGIRVGLVGGITNLVDLEKKLQLKGSTLYIPLKDKLEDGKEYEVHIEEGRYLEYKDYRLNAGEESRNYRNKCYSWKFGTKPIPVSETLFEGSVVENYDTSYPIVIDGMDFLSDIEVYFEDNRGDRYWADRVRLRNIEDGKNRLYIYLPRGRDRLYPGEYKIVIRNGLDHKLEMDYGKFAVIREGDQIPNEESFIKEDKYYGDIYSLRKQSWDKLEVRSSDRNRNYLRIDLDEIMGEETWSRSLEYPIRYGDSIGTLRLESKWADMEIKNLRLDYNYNEKFMDLKVGRASPAILSNLKSKLINVDIKSDFIEVQGENSRFDNVIVDIPYKDSDGQGLKLLRYDQFTRSFFTIPSITDEVNGRVSGVSNNGGIFVIVK